MGFYLRATFFFSCQEQNSNSSEPAACPVYQWMFEALTVFERSAGFDDIQSKADPGDFLPPEDRVIEPIRRTK